MNGDLARRLQEGDRVRWDGKADATGIVTKISRFGVRICWSDGRTTEPFFNDMQRIEMIDQTGNWITR